MPKVLLLIALIIAGCSGEEANEQRPPAQTTPKYSSVTAWLTAMTGRKPLDYASPDMWGCAGATGECKTPISMGGAVTNGTQTYLTITPDPEAKVDCFYLYPTVDWSMDAGNIITANGNETARQIIRSQAAPFSSACRIFAPYYRQAKLGTYFENPEAASVYFRNALLDATAAFEYYLAKWNQGRPLVFIGHSQGAHLGSYLLHLYFDDPTDGTPMAQVTSIEGSRTSGELRRRLVVALPIGWNVFTRAGQRVGGTFSHLPLCNSTNDVGCVIAYRSYPAGYVYTSVAGGQGSGDQLLGTQGFLNRGFDSSTDKLACVNPAIGPELASGSVTNYDAKTIFSDGYRLLAGTITYNIPKVSAGFAMSFDSNGRYYPGRYAAECQSGGWLSIGLHQPKSGSDVRGDPVDLGKYRMVANGTHLLDFHLALGDLIEQVRRRSAAWLMKN